MAQVLRPLDDIFPQAQHPALLVGLAAPDDAAVYQLDGERAIIATMDFFPPVVDDPYAFGAIAAANALSDVYAMGGRPLMALNLAAFPDGLDMAIFSEILRGGAEKVREAGAVIAGGHTVSDKEPKYGLSVTGEVHPEQFFRKGGAQIGDALILTKPLGTGVITTALKNESADPEHVAAVIEGMMRLNRHAAECAREHDVHAVTDITGYSLMGHGHEMAHLSHVGFRLNFEALRWYPGAFDYAEADFVPGGLHRNREYFQQWVTLERDLADWQDYLLYDPQTSGGLLLAVAPERASALLDDLRAGGDEAFQIGAVIAGDGDLTVR